MTAISPTPVLPTLESTRLSLRPSREDDVDGLVAILAEPEVCRWWGSHTAAKVREEIADVRCWTITTEGRVAGWLQVNEEAHEPCPSVAFDIALGDGARGRGLGREALRLAAGYFAGRGHHRFTIDPAVENEAAVRCYRAVGFEEVGVMRAYERGPDGRWRDGLLMDLLAGDLDSRS